ncbi:MAG: hypothetical protein JOZ43_04455, partial [Acidobacteriales bacterium]|nr:hypothetical protein [Terriglobales bacterium]
MGLIFTALFIVLNLLSPADFYPQLAGTRYNLIVAFLAMGFSIPGLIKAQPWRLVQSVFWFGVLFIAMVSSVINGWAGGSIVAANSFITAAAVFFLIMANCTTLSKIRFISATAILCSIFFVNFGSYAVARAEAMVNPQNLPDLLQKFVLWQSVDPDKLAGATSAAQYGGLRMWLCRMRALGELSDPNDLGQFLLVCLMLLWLWYVPGKKSRTFFLILLPSAYLLYGIGLTHSRGALVALGLVLALVIRKKLGTIGAALMSSAMALGVLAVGFTGGRGISSEEGADRMSAWSEGFQMLKARPIVGVGLDQFKDHYEITAHNSFVLC